MKKRERAKIKTEAPLIKPNLDSEESNFFYYSK